ncbi:uncharacterized protein BO95DRAFT_441740 [Aspergillus brunneoviolaceus CBS 621.78]|uniref:Uncharacterized protein n=1 Tax=Aspergillus brunneoviolaceus CBS 621.78 TaxID=1450534 RepID=A0ACD1GC57_9EURO|nr:hypothetical protein BO95DRAFT_441740 [Aspergillus brunneoviolaceus CBS 621.78]RAH46820.1 hypothetical protein BO95DRAFT_441740 [Aspergillus brunneoviolaceus CBS 621.78]
MAQNGDPWSDTPTARCGKHPVRSEEIQRRGTYVNAQGQFVKYDYNETLYDSDGFCAVESCAFRMYNGRWKCHVCGGGPNTEGRCERKVVENGKSRTCNHQCCHTCRAWW